MYFEKLVSLDYVYTGNPEVLSKPALHGAGTSLDAIHLKEFLKAYVC